MSTDDPSTCLDGIARHALVSYKNPGQPSLVRRSCRTSMSSTLRLKRNSDGPRTGSVAQYGRANRAIWDPKVGVRYR